MFFSVPDLEDVVQEVLNDTLAAVEDSNKLIKDHPIIHLPDDVKLGSDPASSFSSLLMPGPQIAIDTKNETSDKEVAQPKPQLFDNGGIEVPKSVETKQGLEEVEDDGSEEVLTESNDELFHKIDEDSYGNYDHAEKAPQTDDQVKPTSKLESLLDDEYTKLGISKAKDFDTIFNPGPQITNDSDASQNIIFDDSESESEETTTLIRETNKDENSESESEEATTLMPETSSEENSESESEEVTTLMPKTSKDEDQSSESESEEATTLMPETSKDEDQSSEEDKQDGGDVDSDLSEDTDSHAKDETVSVEDDSNEDSIASEDTSEESSEENVDDKDISTEEDNDDKSEDHNDQANFENAEQDQESEDSIDQDNVVDAEQKIESKESKEDTLEDDTEDNDSYDDDDMGNSESSNNDSFEDDGVFEDDDNKGMMTGNEEWFKKGYGEDDDKSESDSSDENLGTTEDFKLFTSTTPFWEATTDDSDYYDEYDDLDESPWADEDDDYEDEDTDDDSWETEDETEDESDETEDESEETEDESDEAKEEAEDETNTNEDESVDKFVDIFGDSTPTTVTTESHQKGNAIIMFQTCDYDRWRSLNLHKNLKFMHPSLFSDILHFWLVHV